MHRRATRKLWPFGEVERTTSVEELEGLVAADLAETLEQVLSASQISSRIAGSSIVAGIL